MNFFAGFRIDINGHMCYFNEVELNVCQYSFGCMAQMFLPRRHEGATIGFRVRIIGKAGLILKSVF